MPQVFKVYLTICRQRLQSAGEVVVGAAQLGLKNRWALADEHVFRPDKAAYLALDLVKFDP